MRLATPDRLDLQLRRVLAALGAILGVVGWYRYFG
jgi:hypothetical protein